MCDNKPLTDEEVEDIINIIKNGLIEAGIKDPVVFVYEDEVAQAERIIRVECKNDE